MKLFSKIQLLIFLLSLSLLVACSGSTEGEEKTSAEKSDESQEITLNAVSFIATDNPGVDTVQDWIDSVEEATEGRVKVDWKGGPEVIPVSEQFEAMNSNVVDIVFGFIGQYESQLPESLAFALSEHTPWEERENGFYDYMVEGHEDLNVRYIGRWLTGSPRIWLNEPVEKVEDFNNRVIRTSPNYQRFFNELGISSSMIDQSELYTSLQTGVVEGFVYGTLYGPNKNGWTDTTKYVLDVPFWTQNAIILMNDFNWDAISSEDQQAITEATAEYEKDMVEYYEKVDEEEKKDLKEVGVELFKFENEEEEKKFLDLAYGAEWSYLKDELSEEDFKKVRSLSTKDDE